MINFIRELIGRLHPTEQLKLETTINTNAQDISRNSKSMLPKSQKNNLNNSIICSRCPNICAELSFSIIEYSNKNKVFSVNLSGFIMDVTANVSEHDYYQLQKFIQLQDSKNIYAIDIEFAPYYCPKCDRVYCVQHWSRQTIYDEGFYDAEIGICPNGHRKMLFD